MVLWLDISRQFVACLHVTGWRVCACLLVQNGSRIVPKERWLLCEI